jgi:copper chaperone CopZ
LPPAGQVKFDIYNTHGDQLRFFPVRKKAQHGALRIYGRDGYICSLGIYPSQLVFDLDSLALFIPRTGLIGMKKNFRVPDMYCSACPMHLEGLEDELPGIRYISASYKKMSMEVDFDEKLVTIEQIIDAAIEIGYHPVPVNN